jgi:hypothetical protein
MASFTDSVQQFNPHVKTLPAEAYYQVGLIEQGEFNDGLKRVQGYIDHIDSLPVARDVDKQYIRGALDSLKQGLQTSSVADFSNNQLMNQIGTAASKIASDPIIQRSLASASRVQKGVTELAEAKKAGKSSPQNEWYFTNQVSGWMNSNDLNEQFNGSYNPYIDVVDEIMKVYKDMPDSENIERDGFRMEDGKMVYNPTLLKGKSVERVNAAINLVIGKPDVQNQLLIDGEFKYKDLTPEALAQNLASQTQAQIASINQSINTLKTRAATNTSIESQAISSELDQLKRYAAQLNDKYRRNAELLQQNPSAFKKSLTTDELVSGFMNSFASEIVVENPLWKSYMEEQDFELTKDKFIWQQYNDNRDYELDRLNYLLAVDKAAAEKAKKKVEEQGFSTSPSVVDESLGKVGSETFTQSLNNVKAAYGREMQLQANIIAQEAGIPLPWKENADGTFSPNVGTNSSTQYPIGTSTWKETENIIKSAAEGYAGATPSTTAKIAVDKLRKMKDNINTREKIKGDIEGKLNKDLALAGVKDEDIPYYLVAMVEQGVEGASDIEQTLINTYGRDYKSKLGVFDNSSTAVFTSGETRGPNRYRVTSAKENINNKLKGQILERESAYKNAQGQLQSTNVQLGYTKEAEELPIIQSFDKVVQLATAGKTANKGDAAKLSALLKQDNKTGNVNTYYTEFDDRTQTGSITVRRGTKESETISGIPRTDYFTIFPTLQVDNSFNQKFQDRLQLSNWTTTNVFNSGRNDAYLLDSDKKGDHSVQYHLIQGTSPGTYKLKLWISNKANPQTPIVDGQSFDNGAEQSTQLNRAEVMGILEKLKDPSFLKIYLASKGIK